MVNLRWGFVGAVDLRREVSKEETKEGSDYSAAALRGYDGPSNKEI